MNWYEFIFSNVKPVRILRHVVFWCSWWLYFYGSRFFYPRAFSSIYTSGIPLPEQLQKAIGYKDLSPAVDIWNSTDLIRSLLMLGVHIISTYVIIFFLLQFLLESKYLSFVAGLIALIPAMVIASRFADTTLLPMITGERFNFYIPFYSSVFSGLISPIKVFCTAIAIKLGKRWWLQEQEKIRLEKERSEAELQLLMTQIHPQFLFSTLNNIQSFATEASPKAPEMVLKLADILSYMLYECEVPEVPIEKEIKNIRDFLALQRIRNGDKIEMSINITGKQDDVRIAPLLLFGIIENSIRMIDGSPEESGWINIELDIREGLIVLIVANGNTTGRSDSLSEYSNFHSKLEKRLALQYPGRYQLKVTEDADMMITTLQISGYQLSENNSLAGSGSELDSKMKVSELDSG